jgi:hypothetical protein
MQQFTISTQEQSSFPSTGQKVDQMYARLGTDDCAEQALVLLFLAQAARSSRRVVLEGQKYLTPLPRVIFPFLQAGTHSVSRREDYLESARN